MATTARRRSTSAVISDIESNILLVRGQKVMLDYALASVYGVTTKRLDEQVRRNAERFPEDFMFRLTPEEWTALRPQLATLNAGRGQHRKYMPYVFTEHGALTATNVINSPRAIEASVYVVRAFVRLREMLQVVRIPVAAQKRHLPRNYWSKNPGQVSPAWCSPSPSR